ncbi:primary-amine oxidase [Pseudarthrobacter sp. NamE2]|uniref:primary-amine oxidase n=1 Tax=Pseudarthrobacter sp. NamE2 TaxID=2576838 RepID=UPI0010FF3890|nr:primary-amine oxidase [Pseudarthrobacter sp. NamE2]TLM83712.1 primary-amine oxidase [Pseudarthrobacter sp. NamE2]
MTIDSEIENVVGVSHPLDPLSRAEISRVAAILKEGPAAAESFRFISIELREPDKELLRAGEKIVRQADAVLVNRAEGRSYVAIVDLESGIVTGWDQLAANVQPPFMLDEFAECEESCRKNLEVIAALAKRGITDMELVCFEPWSVGYFGEDSEGRRLMRALVFVREEPDDSPYAHPIENFIVIVDLNTGEVIQLQDDQAIPVPSASGNYLPKYVGPARTDLKPISITQPEGPSFEVNGNHVKWANWNFRVGFTPREGLVLHQLRYRDKDVERPVINRASLSEMVVPYGDTAPVQAKKNAFDSGEYNIGNMANSLTLGCDCTGEIKYFDGITTDSLGNPVTIENAICMHEEDDSILWKHWDFRLDTAETRRNRKLVISFIATVANYEYAFYWHLFLDGSIEFLVKATGILSTAGQKPGEKSPYGQTLNNDGLYAPIHQHMFNVRMDFEVDGPRNAVYEVDMEIPEDNPTHTAFKAVDRLLETEQKAIRKTDSSLHRFWKIVNHEKKNIVDEPVAYRLIPTDGIQLAAGDESFVSKRAQFARNNLWVTSYDRTERFAAGEFPNQATGSDDGLHIWTQKDRNIVDQDLVVWYTFGMHHVVRLEDWPIMPRQNIGFMLEPHGFFDQNPTLDLPRVSAAANHCSSEEGQSTH